MRHRRTTVDDSENGIRGDRWRTSCEPDRSPLKRLSTPVACWKTPSGRFPARKKAPGEAPLGAEESGKRDCQRIEFEKSFFVNVTIDHKRRLSMNPNDQQIYQHYANAWDQGTYHQIPHAEAYQQYGQFVQNAPPQMVEQVHRQYYE